MPQPNVLVILCDQLNASVPSTYGGPLPTPNIDRLARSGVVFERAYCQTPVCTPSRASILTGLYPHRHGLVHNVMRLDYPTTAGAAPADEEGIDGRDVTLGRLLDAQGYRCAHYGKWHLSGQELGYHATLYREHHEYPAEVRQVFRAAEERGPEGCMDWYGWKVPVEPAAAAREGFARLDGHWRESGVSEFYAKMGRMLVRPEDTFDARVADRTIQALRSPDPRPFFLTCSFNWPHDPNVAPSPYYERFDPQAIPFDPEWPCEERFGSELSRAVPVQAGGAFVREFLRIYHACASFVDFQIGRVLDSLHDTDHDGDTIVIFVSDHGDMAGDHGMFWKSTTAFYDGVARVPLVIRAPGLPPARRSFPVELIDLMPTVLELAGCPAPHDVDGESLAPYCRGEADPPGRVAVSERITANAGHLRSILPGQRGSWMITDGRHKYIRYSDGDAYLYDLQEDPRETVNLAGRIARAGPRDRLDARLRERLAECSLPAPLVF